MGDGTHLHLSGEKASLLRAALVSWIARCEGEVSAMSEIADDPDRANLVGTCYRNARQSTHSAQMARELLAQL